MLEQTYNSIMVNYKLGTYCSMIWESKNNGYQKISKGVVRFTNKNIQYNKDNVAYVRIRTTNNPKLKVKTKYFLNGVEITQQEYELNNKTYEINGYFSKHLEDIIKIK